MFKEQLHQVSTCYCSKLLPFIQSHINGIKAGCLTPQDNVGKQFSVKMMSYGGAVDQDYNLNII